MFSAFFDDILQYYADMNLYFCKIVFGLDLWGNGVLDLRSLTLDLLPYIGL